MRHLVLAHVHCAACRHDLGEVPGSDGGTPSDDLAGIDGLFCVSQSSEVKSVGVDLIFVIDTSYSMDFNLKWEAVASSLKSFIADPRFHGIGVGLQYFPLRSTCDVANYAQLDVPIGTLPMHAAAIATSIDAQRMAGGTPTVPAMQGVLDAATQRAMADPDRKVVIVLATDGNPDNSCPPPPGGLPNTVGSVAQLVSGAATSTPRVLTYVVGVGAHLNALDQIAQAGGGAPSAFLVDTTQNVAGAFAQALDSIRKTALACEFTIPPPAPGLNIEYSRVNVTFTTDQPRSLVNVGDAAGCQKAPTTGWFYDVPASPSRIVLCDELCNQVRGADSGKIDIIFGCATVIP
jgi:hypothetical protein